MQNTRLNTLFDAVLVRLEQWFGNPWRRLSLIFINLLLGFFLGTAISTTAGQDADWDMVAAAVVILFTETVSWIVYSRKWRRVSSVEGSNRPTLFLEVLNALKIGLTYSMFVESFKLGS